MPEKQTFSSLEALRQPTHIDTRHDSEATEVDDTLDPRNWSPWRKGLLFLALMSSSLLADGYVKVSALNTLLTTTVA